MQKTNADVLSRLTAFEKASKLTLKRPPPLRPTTEKLPTTRTNLHKGRNRSTLVPHSPSVRPRSPFASSSTLTGPSHNGVDPIIESDCCPTLQIVPTSLPPANDNHAPSASLHPVPPDSVADATFERLQHLSAEHVSPRSTKGSSTGYLTAPDGSMLNEGESASLTVDANGHPSSSVDPRISPQIPSTSWPMNEHCSTVNSAQGGPRSTVLAVLRACFGCYSTASFTDSWPTALLGCLGTFFIGYTISKVMHGEDLYIDELRLDVLEDLRVI